MKKNEPLIIFTPSGKRGNFKVGTPILAAAQKLGVDLDSVCGGRGICSRCQVSPCFGDFAKHGVSVAENAVSKWNSVEERYRDKRGIIEGRRLGCQARILTDVVVDVPEESQVHQQVVRKRAEKRDMTINPASRLFHVVVQPPNLDETRGDLERLQEALQETWQIERPRANLYILRKLQVALRKKDWNLTCSIRLATDTEPARIVEIWPGIFDDPIYGIALDIGSTTIAGHLCNLRTGDVVESSGIMNPQIRFGEDLMSRVSYSMMNENGSQEMSEAVLDGTNNLIEKICVGASIKPNQVLEATIVCNPVMHHLFFGIDPFELGQAPFALATSSAMGLLAKDIGLKVHQNAGIYVLPNIGSHVGSDAAAVFLSEAPQQNEELTLVVDVGTNAEIMLGNRNGILACSSPTGPAFEGAQVSSGQRASPGAIERVRINPKTKNPRLKVVGCDLWSDEDGFSEATEKTGVTGICGSGIIELIAEMRLAGIVDGGGLIGSSEQAETDRCFKDGKTYSYLVFENEDLDDRAPIVVTNQDIREIQMGKAALYSSIRLLMDKLGVDSVDRIVLAGAFGAHISAEHAMILGMIPNCHPKHVKSAGNAAGTGARIALLNGSSRNEIEDAVLSIKKVETAVEPRFEEHFVNASNIPNAVEAFPILYSLFDIPKVNFNSGERRIRGRQKSRSSSASMLIESDTDSDKINVDRMATTIKTQTIQIKKPT